MVDRVAARAGTASSRAREALAIRDEEIAASQLMGARGAELAQQLVGDGPVRAMTICNTGGLASVERGTALAVIQALHEAGRLEEALVLETRPLLQGARLTAWELQRLGAPHRVVVDSAASSLLARGAADFVVTGADRVAANGDTANKIGTSASRSARDMQMCRSSSSRPSPRSTPTRRPAPTSRSKTAAPTRSSR